MHATNANNVFMHYNKHVQFTVYTHSLYSLYIYRTYSLNVLNIFIERFKRIKCIHIYDIFADYDAFDKYARRIDFAYTTCNIQCTHFYSVFTNDHVANEHVQPTRCIYNAITYSFVIYGHVACEILDPIPMDGARERGDRETKTDSR